MLFFTAAHNPFLLPYSPQDPTLLLTPLVVHAFLDVLASLVVLVLLVVRALLVARVSLVVLAQLLLPDLKTIFDSSAAPPASDRITETLHKSRFKSAVFGCAAPSVKPLSFNDKIYCREKGYMKEILRQFLRQYKAYLLFHGGREAAFCKVIDDFVRYLSERLHL